MNYKVKKGVIYCKKGIPHTPRYIVDGRLDFRFEEAGITQVNYISPAQFKGNRTIFLRRLWDGFRYYLEKDKLTYKPEYVNTRVWPFCIEADWNFSGSVIRHRVMAVDESIILQIQTPEAMTQDVIFKLEFYNAFGLTPCDNEDLRFCDMGVERQWNSWRFESDGNMFCGGFKETVKDRQDNEDGYDLNHYKPDKSGYLGCELNVGIGADFEISCFSTSCNSKHILRSPVLQPQKTYSFVISFQPEKSQLQDKMKSLIENMEKKINNQYDRYARAADNSPRLASPYKLLDNYLSLIPLYHESLKIPDHPGAIKANSYAWVWGWDGITASYATAYWNDLSHLRDMLRLYRDTASSFEKNIVCDAGLREIPVWSDAYDMDANQLHCWWPVTGEYFMRLANEFDRKDLIEKWIGWIAYWSEMLMCPEGVSCYIETGRPDLDRWNSLTGLWYGYNMRGWYQAAVHGVFGLDIDAGGITFFPYSGEEMSLKNLNYMGRVYDIYMKGSGPYIESIEVNGALIKGTNKLPADLLQGKKRIRIKVYRTKDNPYKAYIKYGYGIDIGKYSYEDGLIKAELSGVGTCRLKIAASEKPDIKINGTGAGAVYDEASGMATIELVFRLGEKKHIEMFI